MVFNTRDQGVYAKAPQDQGRNSASIDANATYHWMMTILMQLTAQNVAWSERLIPQIKDMEIDLLQSRVRRQH